MRRVLSVFVVMCCAAAPAMAGPNRGGTILFHYNPDAVGTDGNYSGYGGLVSCEDARVSAPPGNPLPGAIYAYAAFPEGGSPRLAVVVAGVAYDENQIIITSWGKTADFELPTTSPAWPAPGSGIAVAWNSPRTERLVEWYWFVGYGYGGSLTLTTHPTRGGCEFVDDAIPANCDAAVDFGSLGFGIDGHRACPTAPIGACCLADGTCAFILQTECHGTWMGTGVPCTPDLCTPTGACCTEDGSCTVTFQADCQEQWQGDGTDCEPNPCPQPMGACCFPDGQCRFLLESSCLSDGGTYMGNGVPCEPNPCPPVPTQQETWGGIKARYR